MQTNFTLAQLADPDMSESEQILRTCVHCGFCTSTCPTYILLGDELDSPRGRIYLMKDMFENGRAATKEVVRHLDRCLSCLSCMTTCPSGVHYMHLVDHGRKHVEETYKRPLLDRLFRNFLAATLPYPKRFAPLLKFGALTRPLARPLRGLMPRRMRALVDLAPAKAPKPSEIVRDGVFAAEGEQVKRVALLTGCAQSVMGANINEAAMRLLRRHGCEVVVAADGGCCGALVHHMGKAEASHHQAKAMIDAWWAETEAGGGAGLDAIVIATSGCGTTIKDYGHMFREDPAYADKAAAIAALARDVTEIMDEVGLKPVETPPGGTIAYHSACSMQHGQKIIHKPSMLLRSAGFTVKLPQESHLCCGSAGVYNLLQPKIAEQLGARKADNLKKAGGEKLDAIVAGNLGCMAQIGRYADAPLVHTAEMLDWATGGPKPHALARRKAIVPKSVCRRQSLFGKTL